MAERHLSGKLRRLEKSGTSGDKGEAKLADPSVAVAVVDRHEVVRRQVQVLGGQPSNPSDDASLGGTSYPWCVERLTKQHADGEPFEFRALPPEHPAREFARKVNPKFGAKLAKTFRP